MQITPEIVVLYQKLKTIYRHRQQVKDEGNKIEVEDFTSRVTVVYEKLRNSVDFKESHLLRRFAVERNLRRRIILETLKPAVAKSLVEELIRAKYLPNNVIPEKRVLEVAQVIKKYNELLLLINDIYESSERQQFFEWLVGVMAVEIDMVLQPEDIEDAVIETMYQITKPRVKFSGDDWKMREKDIQLYIAIHKALVKSDDAIISYHLLNLYFPDWNKADDNTIKLVAANFGAVYRTIQGHLKHPYQAKLLSSLREQVATFQVLYELIRRREGDIEELLIQPELLEAEAKIIINEKYKSLLSKIRSSSIRAIIYIFITKVLLAIAFEFPYELYILKHVNYTPLMINVIFPPLLMFLITLTIVPPKKENTAKILENLKNMVYGQVEQSILCKLKAKYRTNWGFKTFYYSMYTILYLVVFGTIIRILQGLEFNILSGALFLFFLTAVSFFAMKIRTTAKELKIIEKKEGFWSFLVSFFSLPIVSMGRWLSTKFKRINVFAFVMDYIIEAPFKIFIAAFEEWLSFLREKKEDMYREE